MEAASARWDVFISCDEADAGAAATLHDELSGRGRRPFFAGRSLEPGDDLKLEAQRAQLASRITVVLHSSRTRRDLFDRAEIARALNEAEAHLRDPERPETHRLVPVWLEGPPPIDDPHWGLLLKVGLDLRELPGGLPAVAQALDQLLARLGDEEAPPHTDRPFRPLEPFLPQDRDLFFGRDLAVRDLRALIDGAPLCVLHGASGTGKTSLLQAGLRPLCQRGDLWLQVNPRGGLLGQVLAKVGAALEEHGRPLPEAPAEALRELARVTGHRVLLVIDQAEEMFLGKGDEECGREARAVVDLLRAAAAGEVHVLVSIRDDYFGHLHYLRKAGLPGIFQDELLLRPLDATGGRLALEEPLRRAGSALVLGLARRMLEELSEEGGQVSPVELELVCQKLFESAREAGRTEIGEDLYDGMGGAGKVIGTYLAEVLARLPQAERASSWAVLRQLVGVDGTRQEPLALGEVASRAGLPEVAARAALERLVPLRLVRTEDDEGAVYRIAHDRLARAVYDQMGEQERSDLVTRAWLRRQTAAWQDGGRARPWGLDQGLRRDLLGWRARNQATKVEAAYLRQVAQVDRWRRRVGRWGPVAAGAIVLAMAGLLYASYQRGRELQAQAAETKAEAALDKDPSQAMAWIAEAARLRGGILREPERSFNEHWLMAREAWDKGLGWVVAEQKQQIWKVAFSPAGEEGCAGCWPRRRLLAYASGDGTVGLVDLDRGGAAQALPGGHKASATDVTFSPDGRWLTSCGSDSTVRIWEVLSRKQVHVFERAGTEFMKVRFSPDGRHLAIGGFNGGPIYVLDTGSWQARELPGHAGEVKALAFSPDSAWLASASSDGQARLAGVAGGEARELPAGLSLVQDLTFSRDGKRLLLAGREGIRIFHRPFEGPAPDERIESQNGTVVSLDLSTAGVLVWGDFDGKVWLKLPDQPQFLRSSHQGPVSHVEVGPDGEWLLSSGGDDGLVRLTYHQGGWQRTLSGHGGRVNTAASSPDGLLVASGDGTGRVRLWPVQGGRTGFFYAGSTIGAVTGRDPGQWVVAGLQDGRVAVWHGQNPIPSSLGQPGPPIRTVCSLPGDQILAAGEDGWLRRWLSSDGTMEQALRAPEPALSLVCPPAGEATFFSGHTQSILAWSGETSTLVGKHNSFVMALALGADRRTLFSASRDGTVQAWDVQLWKKARLALDAREKLLALALGTEDEVFFGGQGARIHRWNPHTGAHGDLNPSLGGIIKSLATTDDRTLLASASDDQLRLWWPRSGASRPLRGHIGAVTAVHFPPDGQTLLSGGYDGFVRLWPLPPRDRAVFQRWLEAHTPFEIRAGQPVPRPLPPITEDFTGPPPPAPRLHPDCVATCEQAAKDGNLLEGKTLQDCLATCR